LMANHLQRSKYMALWGDSKNPPLDLLKNLSQKTRFALHQIEMTLWLVDTLATISTTKMNGLKLYLKGGTCVQHYLPAAKQRFSQDLDLAVVSYDKWQDKIPKIEKYLKLLNDALVARGWKNGHGLIRPANPTGRKEFPFIYATGRVFQSQKWPRNPSQLFGRSSQETIAFVRVEFFLHETRPDYHRKSLEFEITSDLRQVSMNIATKDRLAADKIIAMAGGYGGRQDFKDVLDYHALVETGGLDKEKVADFIAEWARTHVDSDGTDDPIEPPVKVLHDALRNLEEQSKAPGERLATAMATMYARGRAGYFTEIERWKGTCRNIGSSIRELMKLPAFAQT